MRRWAVETQWPEGIVTFVVFENGVISEVYPTDSRFVEAFSSIEGFDLPGTLPDPGLERPSVSIEEAVNGRVDVSGCSVVAYPSKGISRYIHTTGSVASIHSAPEVP